MPYSIRKSNGKYQVITSATGKVHGTHSSESKAKAQLRAIYANAPPENEGKKWTKDLIKRKTKR